MRISRIHAAALVAGLLAIAGRPEAAFAQQTAAPRELVIGRTIMGPAEQDSADVARFDAVNKDLNDLFDAQRAYFQAHRRFAAELTQLPAFAQGAPSGISMTAGPEWYVALGGNPQTGVMQQVVYFKEPESTQVAAGGTVVQTERVAGTMTRPR
ncbi:hypothetical protein [Longimicrobium sp.]|uniref:hypothetical protein n=1 Tax=Longimicrobium sp. TaxID=2029185 RepID=UPI002E30768E|nr:hypothetical protein [Longimicrobium sp.]HEX6037958.1 hypothetical protein [Longimicrobium sp.]